MFGSSFAIWINGTQPTLLGHVQPGNLPKSTFPFERLVNVNAADQSATFLYHQINSIGTTFAEEQWDASVSV